MTGSAPRKPFLNLVNKIYEPEELLPNAVALAARVVKNGHPDGLRLMKKLMNQPLRDHLDVVLEREQDVMLEAVSLTGGFDKNNPKAKL